MALSRPVEERLVPRVTDGELGINVVLGMTMTRVQSLALHLHSLHPPRSVRSLRSLRPGAHLSSRESPKPDTSGWSSAPYWASSSGPPDGRVSGRAGRGGRAGRSSLDARYQVQTRLDNSPWSWTYAAP